MESRKETAIVPRNMFSEADLKKGVEALRQSREMLTQLVVPSTPIGRVRFEIAQRLSFLRDVLEVSPMENMRAELRKVLTDLTTNLPNLVENGRLRIDKHRELLGFYEEAQADPDNWELTLRLKQRLQAEANQNRELKLDEQTEKLIGQILRTDNPEEKKFEQERIFDSTKQRLSLTEPIVRVTEASIKATARLRESLMEQYSTVLDISPDLEQLHRNSGVLLDGILSGRASKEIIIRTLEQAIQTADLVLNAIEINRDLDQARDLPRLSQISDEAKQILGSIKNGDS